MKILKSLGGVLVLAALVLALMVVKTFRDNKWPGDPGEAARELAHRTAFISPGSLSFPGTDVHLLKLENPAPDSLSASWPSENVTLVTLADRQFIKRLTAESKKWVLLADDPAMAVNSWVMLRQAGVKNIFILLRTSFGGEELKYKFRPDTTFRPEPAAGEIISRLENPEFLPG